MKIDDFANGFLGSSSGFSNIWNNPKFDNLSNILGGYEKANTLLVTTGWQTLIESPDFSKKLYPRIRQRNKSKFSLLDNSEKYILCLGEGKYCLLVFDPKHTSDEPLKIDASKNNSSKSMSVGYNLWRSKMENSIKNRNIVGFTIKTGSTISNIENAIIPQYNNLNILDENILNTFEPEIIQYSINNSEWPMIICKPPKRVYTSLHPNKPHKVALGNTDNFKSLAGVYTRNEQGVFGATICLHSFPDSNVEIGKTKVSINGLTGTVISAHNISDSCFVQLDATEVQITGILKDNGPLIGSTPRDCEVCYFTNKEEEKVKTNVIGWSVDLLNVEPYNQLKVLTNPCTNPGDSGSALIDSDDHVLGFSFYRTEINAPKEFSAWIWAASVFQVHNLKYQ